MFKKILIIVGALVILGAGVLVYLNYRNRTLSPPGIVDITNGGLSVKIAYSRPSVRGRLIFGPESDGALQPYGKYWRLGANEATEITFNKDVFLNGKQVKAGTYTIYAVPDEQEIIIGLNTETDRWGYSEPDYSKDLFRTPVKFNFSDNMVEQFSIRGEGLGNRIDIIFNWANREWKISLSPA